jgi:hypothetical protein
MSSPGPKPNPFSNRAANKREEVHFYPGDKILLYLVDGKMKLKAEAWGGPPVKEAREAGEPMGRAPTYSGVFVIDRIAPYTTKTWPMSEIPWGAKIRESKTRSGGVEYLAPSGKWRPLLIKTRDRQIVDVGRIKVTYEALHRLAGFPDTWIFNDFGPLAIRYYRDRNRNGRRDANERLEGEMIHTTPYNEAQSEDFGKSAPEIELDGSHGCIHIKPIDRDAFIDAGAFRQGMPLIIHGHDETFVANRGSEGQ